MNDSKGFAGMLKLGIILALYAAAACVGLAFVYTGTAEVIAMRTRADLEGALKGLFGDADGFESISGAVVSGDPLVVFEDEYAITREGRIIGAAIRASRGSYGGDLKVLVGVGIDGVIKGIRILEHKDTPGLGANAASESYYIDRGKGLHFYDQFAGKSPGDPFEVKDDVVVVTAATITSRAVAAAVKAAGEAAFAWLSENAGGTDAAGRTAAQGGSR
jgi:electron transport complex protein RnfG